MTATAAAAPISNEAIHGTQVQPGRYPKVAEMVMIQVSMAATTAAAGGRIAPYLSWFRSTAQAMMPRPVEISAMTTKSTI